MYENLSDQMKTCLTENISNHNCSLINKHFFQKNNFLGWSFFLCFHNLIGIEESIGQVVFLTLKIKKAGIFLLPDQVHTLHTNYVIINCDFLYILQVPLTFFNLPK